MLNRYFSTLLLPIFLIKTTFLHGGLADALIIAALAGLFCFYLYLESKKEPVANKDLIDRIIYLETQTVEMKSKVSAIQIGNQFRNIK